MSCKRIRLQRILNQNIFLPNNQDSGQTRNKPEPVPANEPHAQHAGKSHLNPNSDFSEEGQMAIIRTFGHKWRLQDEQL